MDRDAVADGPTTAPKAAPERHGTTPASAASDRRLLIVLGLASFLAVVNFAAPSPFFPEIARDLGTTVPLLGQVTTILTLLSAILGLGVGPLADRYGHRRLMVGGVVAIAVNLLGTGLAPAYPLLLLLAVVGGLGDAVLFGLPLAIAATHFTGEARRRAVSWTSAGVPLGTVVGVPLLAAAGGIVGWRGVLAGAGVATLGAAWLVATWLPAEVSRRHERFRMRSLLDAYRPLLRHPPTLVLYAVSGLRAAGWVGMLTYLGAFLTDTFGFGPGQVGLAYMTAGAGAFLGGLAAAGRLGRVRPRPLAAAATAVQGLLFGAVFALSLDAVAVVSLLPLAAFGGTIAFVGVVTLLADETPGGAATTMVLNGSVFNLGTAAGVALGGVLIALGGYGALGIGLPVFALVASLLALVHARPRRHAP